MIGDKLGSIPIVFTKNRDFRWGFRYMDDTDTPVPFPAGRLYIEFQTSPVTEVDLIIDGSEAVLKIESEQVALIPARTRWQLVFLPDGEPAGGDPIAIGSVQVQG